jgi:ribonuclease P protein component
VLSQLHRLRKRQDFTLAYQKGKCCSGVHLLVRVRRRTMVSSPTVEVDPPTRFGISVSQKVSKRAVQRNRVKRRLRAACRQLLPLITPGWDVVIVVRSGTSASSLTSKSKKNPKASPSQPQAISPQPLQCGYQEFLQELRQLLVATKIIHKQ